VAGCSNLAWYQLRNEQPIGALQSATRAVDLDANHLEAREHLGLALIVAGDEDRAVEQLAQAVTLSRNQMSENRVAESGSRVDEIRRKLDQLRRLYPARHRAIRTVLRRQREWAQ
jgi:tetratricopeptide (TPR) repeat protein